MGIGDGRLIAPPVAGRAGVRSRAFRADPEAAAIVETGDRSATGPHRFHLHGAQPQRDARKMRFMNVGHVSLDERHVGGRAAHVERDDGAEPFTPCQRRGGENPTGRPGENGAHRLARHLGRGRRQPARLQHPQRRFETAREGVEVFFHDRLQPGVRGSRGEALELPVFPGDGRRKSDPQPGPGEHPPRGRLVAAIPVGMQKADRHPPHALPPKTKPQSLEARAFGAGEGPPPSVGPGSLVEAEPQPPWHERRRRGCVPVVEVWPVLPADLDEILESPCRDEGGRSPAPLEQGVRRDRRAVTDEGGGTIDAELPEAVQNGPRRIVGSGTPDSTKKPREAVEASRGCKQSGRGVYGDVTASW